MAEKLNWVDLRRAVMAQSGANEKEATAYLNALVETIKTGLQQDKQVRISGLGTFKLQTVAPRKSVNVVTGEDIVIEAYSKIIFVPESNVKESVALGRVGKDPMEKLGQQATEIVALLGEMGQGPKAEKPTPEDSGTKPTEAKNGESKPTLKKRAAKIYYRWVDWLILLLTIVLLLVLCTRYKAELRQTARNLNLPAYWEKAKQRVAQALPNRPAEQAEPVEQYPVVADSVAIAMPPQTADAICPEDTIAQEPTVAPMPQAEESPAAPKAKEPCVKKVGGRLVYKEYIGTETVRKGSRLTQMARRHYGKQELWVFIYDANRQKIKNPDNLNAGTRLRIPKLTPELQDLNNPETQATIQRLRRQAYQKR